MGESSMAPLPSSQPADSFFQRAVGVFISPGQTFQRIVRRPDFLAPLALATAAYVVVIETWLAKFGVERIAPHAHELNGKTARMSPEQVQHSARQAAMIGAIVVHWIAVFAVPIFSLAIAALGLFVINVIFRQSVSFQTVFSVICYASLVRLVVVIMDLIVILRTDVQHYSPQMLTPATLAIFLDAGRTSKPLYEMATSLDTVRIWCIALSSLGLSLATGRKVHALKIFLTGLGIWMLVALGHAAFSALRP